VRVDQALEQHKSTEAHREAAEMSNRIPEMESLGDGCMLVATHQENKLANVADPDRGTRKPSVLCLTLRPGGRAVWLSSPFDKGREASLSAS
jgi:hypothetical protein